MSFITKMRLWVLGQRMRWAFERQIFWEWRVEVLMARQKFLAKKLERRK